jgi:hypothetical protein
MKDGFMRNRLCLIISISSITCSLQAQQSALPEQQDRWKISSGGGIEWKVNDRLPHDDHVEMSGEKISMWVQYGVNSDGQPSLNRTMIFPTFRLLPVRTLASMTYNVTDGELPRFLINDRLLKAGVYNATVAGDLPEKVVSVWQKGILQISSVIGKEGTIALQRTLFPSVDKPVAVEKWVFTNTGKQPVKIEMEYLYREVRPATERTTPVQHSFVVNTVNEGLKTVAPGDSVQFAILYQAIDRNNPLATINVTSELNSRQQRLADILSLMQLETPDTILNTAFAFAKIRATESIFKTKGGYMHGPGGLRYYAAIWANDQAEYINPFFAMLGDETGNRSAMNAYRWFARYMNDEYRPIPSSIIAEGDATWHGAKDRGDMAMIAYGASRYALAYGNADSAKVLWPLIGWCLEYLKKKIDQNGVVASNSDELEGRFPAGKANLNTSILYYDALRSASMLGKLLGAPKEQITRYANEAQVMRSNIEKFFGASVEGFNTYRYYEGNDTLRAWICSPLTVGLFERKAGTIAALFSPRLWTADGLASLAGNTTFWDRSTLYALRGVLAAGETEKAMAFLRYYSKRRLLGEHVPYPVEAYPEGNQRHLSAESGLYCRIYTEGLFSIRPVSFNSFECTPRLPQGWDQMALKNMHAFGNVFDIIVNRLEAGKLGITIKNGEKVKKYVVKEGATQTVQL